MTNEGDLIDFARISTRPPGKCLGLANNDIVGRFGKLGNLPYSAKVAADQLVQAGQLHTGGLPHKPVAVFYDYVEGGVNYGHVDWWLPSLGKHLADSSRCTTWLNGGRTVGLYSSWGEIRGWADVPALGAQITVALNPAPAPPVPSGDLRQVQGDGVVYYEPVGALAQRIGAGLIHMGRVPSNFSNDGDPGIFWRKGVQLTAEKAGYVGPIDGRLGHIGLVDVQRYAKRGGYSGPLDGDPRVMSWTAFAKGLELP